MCFRQFLTRPLFRSHVSTCSPVKRNKRKSDEIPIYAKRNRIDSGCNGINYSIISTDEGNGSSSGRDSGSSEDWECSLPSKRVQKKLSQDMWSEIKVVKRKTIPGDIDGKCHYKVKFEKSVDWNKLKDGRRWGKSGATYWQCFERTRYYDCRGCFICNNDSCGYAIEFGRENKVHFDKDGNCTVCGSTGEILACNARKYVAQKANEVHVFHIGRHNCCVQGVTEKPTEMIHNVVHENPGVKPATVQSNFILRLLRDRKPWDEVATSAATVVDRKMISNEKIKARKVIDPDGTGETALRNFKAHTDRKDRLLIYRISTSPNPIVFKSSTCKMKIASKLNPSSGHFLSTGYVYFDGTTGRCKETTTLTASIYHPLLKKQVPLAILECPSENSQWITMFWSLFKEGYQEVNGKGSSFEPKGWISDMAGANMEGLRKVFGEEVLSKIKGCEWHYKDGVNKRAKQLRDCGGTFKKLAHALLEAETKEGYERAKQNMETFISAEKSRAPLQNWLRWWDEKDISLSEHFLIPMHQEAT